MRKRGSRHELAEQLALRGFSYTQSRRLVDLVFATMARGLAEDGTLETPFGSFKVVPNQRPIRLYRLNRIVDQRKDPWKLVWTPPGQ